MRVRWRSAVAGVVGWLAAPGPVWAFGHGVRVWLPPAVSSYAPVIDQLFYFVLAVTGAVFVLVQGTLLVFLIRYRSRPGHQALYTHGNTTVEIVWTVIPALILIVLAFYSQNVWSYVQGTPPPHDLEVQITAEQFAWNIAYPGPDGTLGTPDDVTTINQLHLPVHRTVLISLRSKDVIHSFFVPQFRLKLDAVPGLTGHLWVTPMATGSFDIACAELCGLGHYRMRGYLTIEPAEAFQAWLAQTQAEQGS